MLVVNNQKFEYYVRPTDLVLWNDFRMILRFNMKLVHIVDKFKFDKLSKFYYSTKKYIMNWLDWFYNILM